MNRPVSVGELPQLQVALGVEPSTDGGAVRLTVQIGPIGGSLILPMDLVPSLVARLKAAWDGRNRVVSAASIPKG